MTNYWQLSYYILFSLILLVSCETMQERCAEKNLDLDQDLSALTTKNEAKYTNCFSSRKSDLAPPEQNKVTIFEL